MFLLEYYSADLWRVISLVTWIVAWSGANLLSKGSRPFLAHVLYSLSNIGLLFFNAHHEHWEMVAMATTFLFTSVRGCINYWPKGSSHMVMSSSWEARL